MNLYVCHTEGNIGTLYGYNDVLEWIKDIEYCLETNTLPDSGFLPQEVIVGNIGYTFMNNHRIFICGNKTEEFDNVIEWLEGLTEEERNVFSLRTLEIYENEEPVEPNGNKNEIRFYFEVK